MHPWLHDACTRESGSAEPLSCLKTPIEGHHHRAIRRCRDVVNPLHEQSDEGFVDHEDIVARTGENGSAEPFSGVRGPAHGVTPQS